MCRRLLHDIHYEPSSGRLLDGTNDELQSPNTDPPFEVTGSGTWVFNRKAARPESADYNYKFVVKKPNATVTYPITV